MVDLQKELYVALRKLARVCCQIDSETRQPCQNLATTLVSWSDRDQYVCDRHVETAQEDASNDGISDRTDSPATYLVWQDEQVLRHWGDLRKQYCVTPWGLEPAIKAGALDES